MAARTKDKAVQDFDNQHRELNKQLGEQLKFFDARTESKLSILTDYHDFYKRLGEVELEYARNLEKISERFYDRVKQKLAKKEKMNTVDIFGRMIQDFKQRTKNRLFIATRVTENMVNRFTTLIEDVQRVNKRCRETSITLQEEFTKQLSELSNKQRRYHVMQTDSKQAEAKLKAAEGAQKKLQAPRKKASVKRAKNADKQREKYHTRYTEAKKKAMRARNEYILCLEATNAFVKKYFDQDIYDVLECYDHNYQQAFQRAMDYSASMEIQTAKLLQKDLVTLKDNVKAMDTGKERTRIALDNPNAFQFAAKFEFINHSEDEVCQITIQDDTLDELHADVEERLKTAKSETEEINKNLEVAKETLRNTYDKLDKELSAGFSNEKGANAGVETSASRINREDSEDYYLSKFKELIMTSSVRTRLQAKYTVLQKTLGGEPGRRLPQLPMKPTAKTQKMIQSAHKKYQLFGSKLEDHIQVTGRDVPEIVESCVRFIKKFGMEHQGIFRVPGSSTEINDLKEAFENGRDPLAGLNHWKDINAVAGVLRCYFRELEEPLFPRVHYQEFIEASRIYDIDEQARQLNHLIKKLPDAVVHVMRFLFNFLSQIPRYKERNKMDAHNLAVVFGPTLIRVSEEDDMISLQGHFNKVIETIIKCFDVVFDGDGLDAVDNDEEESRQTEDEISRYESDSDEEVEPRDAKALYDYRARSDRELSFKKGDIIQVFKRSNDDWWDGCLDGLDGFVPCAYVQLLEEDHVDGYSPDSISPPSLTFNHDIAPVADPLSSPTPRSPSTPDAKPVYGMTQTQNQMSFQLHPKTSSDSSPGISHFSSFKRGSFKLPQQAVSPSQSPSNSLDRSRSLTEKRSVTPEDKNRTASLPRSSAPLETNNESPIPVGLRGVAEGSSGGEPASHKSQTARPPPPKPKPKPKVPKRLSNPSTDLIASLQAGTAARSARHDSQDEMSEVDDLPPPPPPDQREIIGGVSPPPRSPVGKQDTFL